jgi:hypothetical protein
MSHAKWTKEGIYMVLRRIREDQERTMNEQEKQQLMRQKLGFEPNLFCHIAGVTMEPRRQVALERASQLVTASSTLSCLNGGMRLTSDKTNKFDSWAMQVWMATRLVGGQFQSWEEVGFIPRKICLGCHESFAARDFDKLVCPKCGDVGTHPMRFLNMYIRQNYFDQGKGIFYAAWWINQARDKPSSWGCKLALGLPPV